MIYYYLYIALSHGVITSLFCLSDLEVIYFGLFLPVAVNYSMCHHSCYHLVRIPVAYSKYSPLIPSFKSAQLAHNFHFVVKCLVLYSRCCLRLCTSPKSEGGEGCGCWNQLNHLILEAHTRSIWVQSLLDPLPGCGSIHIIIILKHWAAILMHYLFTSFFPASGGDQKSSVLSGASNRFTISKLRESSAYKVHVSAMVDKREGSPVLVTARTCEDQ